MSTAFVFPGQGSHSVGMLAALAAATPIVQRTFGEASSVLGYDLWQRVSEGPAELLNATECQQPAMLVAGVATWRAWQEAGGFTPDIVLGHSLGEFTALVAANALDFATAVALVQRRGQLMQAAVPQGAGAMAAILGLDDAQVEQACADVAGNEVVQAVNFNSPGQVVIAGHAAAVNRAIVRLKELGAKRAVLLSISVPAHSVLLEDAARSLRPSVDAAGLRAPQITFWSPVDASPHNDAAELAELLQRQLAQPVRWSDTIRALVAAGVTRFVECGPGEVLAGLNKRITKGQGGVTSLALTDPGTMQAVKAAFAADTTGALT
jgi:[acyl-carrier-protein] S-malonyltransferase